MRCGSLEAEWASQSPAPSLRLSPSLPVASSEVPCTQSLSQLLGLLLAAVYMAQGMKSLA